MTFLHRFISTATIVAIVVGALPARAAQGTQSQSRPTNQQGQTPPPATPAPAPGAPRPATPPAAPAGVTPPSGYVIGADDVLVIVFWQDKDMSGEVSVRPDGKISLPLINDIHAAGLTPSQLRDSLEEAAAKFLREPNATVVVKQINSRKVFITGQVTKPGGYSLTAPTTVLQHIAMAGGLLEYAKSDSIVVLRTQNGKKLSYRFNYKEVAQQKRLDQNVELQVGDTVLVP
jgi:polysaccharide export outer membrane protein